MFLSSLLSSHAGRVPYRDADGEKYYLYEEVWTEYAENTFSKVFLYVAIALAVILIAVGVFVKLKREDKFAKFMTIAVSLAVGFAITVIVTMLALQFIKIGEKNYGEYDGVTGLVLIPSCILAGSVVLGIAACYISSLFTKKAFRITSITAVSIMGAALIAFFVCLVVYFHKGWAEANNWDDVTDTENVLLYVSAAAIVIVEVVLALVFGRGENKEFDTKSISYAAICIALSFALSYVKMFSMPQGGSVTLASLLPLMLYSYMFGVRKGVFAGFIYGVLQCVQTIWFLHPAQFLLDYPVAFAAIGVAGVFAGLKKLDKLPQIKFALGATVAGALRYICHVLSGVFAFNAYAEEAGLSSWVYSLGYNAYVFIDLAIVIVAGFVLFCVPSFVAQVKKIRAAHTTVKKVPAENAEAVAPADEPVKEVLSEYGTEK
ncbi:MAG: energy-coupled thiamine transporter ThiT [Clostridia bacterium]|nr:energy-coupled thiamine transporter ThiT [Clostridia bacterium]